MKLPRLKIRKSTRSTISGVLIALASLYALASAYDEAKNNLLRFFIMSVSLLLLIAVFAAAVVLVKVSLKALITQVQKSREQPDNKDAD